MTLLLVHHLTAAVSDLDFQTDCHDCHDCHDFTRSESQHKIIPSRQALRHVWTSFVWFLRLIYPLLPIRDQVIHPLSSTPRDRQDSPADPDKVCSSCPSTQRDVRTTHSSLFLAHQGCARLILRVSQLIYAFVTFRCHPPLVSKSGFCLWACCLMLICVCAAIMSSHISGICFPPERSDFVSRCC
jgi:hypothetical protein